MNPANAAIYYHPDGFDTSRPKLMGRQAAGDAFLKAFIRHVVVDFPPPASSTPSSTPLATTVRSLSVVIAKSKVALSIGWLLLGNHDIAPDGSKSAAIEQANEDRFRATARALHDELLRRAQAAAGARSN